MRVAELIIASCVLAVGTAGVASAQFVEPFKVLEEARRDRLAMEQRLAREAAARRQREKEDTAAAQVNAQRKPGTEGTSSASGALTPSTLSTQLAPSSAREVNPGTPSSPSSSPQTAGVTHDPKPPEAEPAQVTVVGPAVSPDEQAGAEAEGPLRNPTAAPSAQEVSSEGPIPAVSGSGYNPSAANPSPAPPTQEGIAGTPIPSPPRVVITVDKAAQRMQVTVDGRLRHTWAVSTGRAQYETPAGTFRPLRLAKVHYSREWDDAPMPYSIFFTDRGHAIHGSNATHALGRRASHGCVRLAPSKAAVLFALVQAEGAGATKVVITGGSVAAKTVRPRAAEAHARKLPRVQRASTDTWQLGQSDGWAE